MSNDLISRKALLECFNPDDKETPWAIAARARIIKQPTAYDPDKVVEQIHEYFKGQLDIRYEELKPSNEVPMDAVDDLLSHNKAVCEIVERGGTDET